MPVDPKTVTRRQALGGAAALAATAATFGGTRFALAQDGGSAGAPTKGPLVWLAMNQKELVRAYAQSIFAPNIRRVIARWKTNNRVINRHYRHECLEHVLFWTRHDMEMKLTKLLQSPSHTCLPAP